MDKEKHKKRPRAPARAPWTLASNESWNKTHSLGGKVFTEDKV